MEIDFPAIFEFFVSTTIGSRPFWSLPVDSATSCSIQSPNPGTFEVPSWSEKFWSVCSKIKVAIFTATELSSAKVFEAISASSIRTETSTPNNAAGTSPNALRALNRPPTLGSAFITRRPVLLAETSSGDPGSVTITK